MQTWAAGNNPTSWCRPSNCTMVDVVARAHEISRCAALHCAQASAAISHDRRARGDIAAQSCSRALVSTRIFTRTIRCRPLKPHLKATTPKVRWKNREAEQLRNELCATYEIRIVARTPNGSLHAGRSDRARWGAQCVWICGGRPCKFR